MLAAPSSAAARHRRRLTIVLALTGTYMFAEATGGWLTGGLALVAAVGLAVNLIGVWLPLIWSSALRPFDSCLSCGCGITELSF